MAIRPGTTPELPTLDDGVYRLTTDEPATGPLHALVCDHLLFHDGPALWVDAAGHAQSGALARVAPSDRLLDRIRVARGITAFQHLALVDELLAELTDETALVVLPALDRHYREDDLARGEPARLVGALADRLERLVAAPAPVLVTTLHDDDLVEPLADAVDHELACEGTRFGPRFVGDAFETLVYRDGGPGVQTTLAFWARVLTTRQQTVDSPLLREVTARGAH